MSEFAHALLDRQYAGQQLEKSRFARAVGTNEDNALSTLSVKV